LKLETQLPEDSAKRRKRRLGLGVAHHDQIVGVAHQDPRPRSVHCRSSRCRYVLDKLGVAILEPAAATIKAGQRSLGTKFGS
jgi:hypothetical protein